MRLEIQKIILKNYMSYVESEYTFDTKGFTQVIGINNTSEDNTKNNGSGKTSCFNAISWCLFGITPSGIKDVQNIFNDNPCEVTLDFNLDGKQIQITRGKRPTKLEIIVNGNNVSGKGIRDTEKIVESYLGNLTPEVLNAVIILGQGLPHRLTNHTPSGRKELLEKLSQSDYMIEDLKTKVSNRENQLKQIKRDYEDTILVSKTNLNRCEQDIQLNQSKLNELINLDISTLQQELSQLDDTTLKNRSKDIKEQLEELNQLRAENVEKIAKLIEEKPILIDITQENNRLVELRTLLLSKQNELKNIENIKTTCPTCQQNLPHAHKPDTTNLKQEILSIIEQGKKQKEIVERLIEQNKQIQTKFDKEVETKQQILKQERNKIIEKSEPLVKEEEQINQKISQMNIRKATLTLQIENHENELKTITSLIENNNKSIKELTNTLDKTETELTITEQSIQVVTKMQTLLKRDFRGILLQNVLNYLQTRFDNYAEKVFNNKGLKLELNGTNLDISLNKKVYESLSGGEKTKVDIIVQLSIRDLLINQFQFYSNIIVIDEVTDFLDEQGAEYVYQLFTDLGVEQTYIISHRKDFTFPVDNQLTIIKENNYSCILEK